MKNNTQEKGFIAMVLVLFISGLLLVFSFTQSIEIFHFFDQVNTKKYRLMNYYNAYSCIDQAVLNISHDFFYRVEEPVKIPDLNCSIKKVFNNGDFIDIETQGDYKKVIFKRKARIRLYDNRVEILSID